eukprot:TRINITY_DN3179_c0_g1_i1.p1 TRINITY_DN3179_c0_g1~~TRINITY_DN3179_c0_g1_i1.p1  ORF type:complete len:179 (+),score=13.00 TRINITY_DN3179_c0_g1_i1:453-989(+)
MVYTFHRYPIIEQTAMFITTRVDVINQTLNNCTLDTNTCTYVNIGEPQSNFISSIENFTILIDHSMYATALGIQKNSISLHGYLLDSDGNRIHDIPVNNSVGVEGKTDVLDISLLLRAAGIKSLDDPSPSNNTRSMRDGGIVLLMFITYSNTYSYNTANIRYEYSVAWKREWCGIDME